MDGEKAIERLAVWFLGIYRVLFDLYVWCRPAEIPVFLSESANSSIYYLSHTILPHIHGRSWQPARSSLFWHLIIAIHRELAPSLNGYIYIP